MHETLSDIHLNDKPIRIHFIFGEFTHKKHKNNFSYANLKYKIGYDPKWFMHRNKN